MASVLVAIAMTGLGLAVKLPRDASARDVDTMTLTVERHREITLIKLSHQRWRITLASAVVASGSVVAGPDPF
jgi:hypothetical protein